MLISEQHLLKSRVGSVLGSLFLGSWALGCGLVIWTVTHGENPLAEVMAKSLPERMVLSDQ